MKTQDRRRFLFIGNIIISVLCVAAILGYFLLPLFRASFSVTVTPELAEQAADIIAVESSIAAKNTSSETDMSSMLKNVIRSVGASGLTVSFSSSFSSSSFIGALFDRKLERADALIDDAVDQLVDNAGNVISALISSVASAAAKEVVKNQVGEIIKANDGDTFEGFMEDLGGDSSKIDSLIDGLIKAIMDDNATVDSVTEKALESADEVQELLLGVDKYSEHARSYGDEEKEGVRKMCKSVLGAFADENGKLQFKEALIGMILDFVNKALSGEGVNISGASGSDFVYTASIFDPKAPRASVAELTDQLKTRIKTLFYDAANGKLPDFALSVMAVNGALILVCLFLLFYPILRTLTNIGKDNPGFVLVLPIIGGILPFTFLVLIPSAGPAILKAAASGNLFNPPDIIKAVVNAVSISYFSGTIVAFFAAVIIFIFGFFYSYQRRKLKKELSAAETAPVFTAPAAALKPASEPASEPAASEDAEEKTEEN